MEIRIKNHLQPSLDFSLPSSEEETVLELKKRLRDNYPTNPSVGSQQLIFAGRVLENEDTVGDLVKQYSSLVHTFHLLEKRTTPPRVEDQPVSQPDELRRRRPEPRGIAGAPQWHPVPPMGNFHQQNHRGFFETQNYGLLLKLALILYLFGRGAGPIRLAFMFLGAFVIYMYKIGLLGSRPNVRLPAERQPPPAPLFVPDPPVRQHPPAEHAIPATDNEPTSPPDPDHGELEEGPSESAATAPVEISQGVHTPASQSNSSVAGTVISDAEDRNVSFLREIENVVGPFFYSLVPFWTPETGFA